MRFITKLLVLFLLPVLALGQYPENKFKPLLNAAKKSNSDALIVMQGGKKIIDYHRDSDKEKIESMSVTKSIVGLAVAQLLTEQKIDSLDTPVGHYYPEWKQGQKKNITIRHLMNHTSGLQNIKKATAEIYPSPDFIQLALCASVVDKPGTKFSYNNKAVNILAGIIRKAAGQEMDTYLGGGLFKEMGITDFEWESDKAGNPVVMAGFSVLPSDLAKLGQLVLQNGSWNGKQLIDEQWIEELLAQGQPHNKTSGLLWWRVPASSNFVIDDDHIQKMINAGFDRDLVADLEQIKGEYDNQKSLLQNMRKQFGRKKIGRLKLQSSEKQIMPWKATAGPVVGYQAKGYLGQYLTVFPEQDVVAVRMIKSSEDYNRKTDGFENFSRMVYELASSESSPTQ